MLVFCSLFHLVLGTFAGLMLFEHLNERKIEKDMEMAKKERTE